MNPASLSKLKWILQMLAAILAAILGTIGVEHLGS